MTAIYDVSLVNFSNDELKRVFFVSEDVDEVLKQYNDNYKSNGYEIVNIIRVNENYPVHIV